MARNEAEGRHRLAGLRGRMAVAWKDARSGLWLTPSLLVIAAAALSAILVHLDATVAKGLSRTWLFRGSPEGARTILSTIAGSAMTVVAVSFSITMIAMQQASTLFTPRALRNFTRDRGNQIVLGTYLATFTYALLVLRQVRSATPEAEAFVPAISMLGAIALALTSLGLLVYFIHHASQSLQVSHLLSDIRGELDAEIERMFPEALRGAEPEPAADLLRAREERGPAPAREIRSSREGYLRRIDEAALASAIRGRVASGRVGVRVGDYVRRGDVLFLAWDERADGEGLDEEAVRHAFVLARLRSIQQDPLYGLRQLADVGVKALSPGVHDPTTAEEAIDKIGGALLLLVDRRMAPPAREIAPGSLVLVDAPAFRDYVETGLSQIRRSGRSQPHVVLHLLSVARALVERAPTRDRAEPLLEQVREVLAALPHAGHTPADEERVRAAAASVLRAGVGGERARPSSLAPARGGGTH